jgi:hypothetical protein
VTAKPFIVGSMALSLAAWLAARREPGGRIAKDSFGRARSSRIEHVDRAISSVKKLIRARNQDSAQAFESGANHCAQTEGESHVT